VSGCESADKILASTYNAHGICQECTACYYSSMLYCYYGADAFCAKKKAREMARTLLAKRPDAAFRELDSESFNRASFDEMVSGAQGLFSSRALMLLDGTLSADDDIAKHILSRLQEMGGSENIFILAEGSLPASIVKKVEKHAEKCAVYLRDEKKEVPQWNIFSLADALARRDRQALWTGLLRARRAGVSPEEIAGTLAWQARTILISQKLSESDAARAGVKGFPYKKARRAGANFNAGEAEALSSRLVELYHAARRGEGDFAVALELFALTL